MPERSVRQECQADGEPGLDECANEKERKPDNANCTRVSLGDLLRFEAYLDFNL